MKPSAVSAACLTVAGFLAAAALPHAASATPADWSSGFALQTAGGVVNPAILVAFNPQPEPPAYVGETLFSTVGGAAQLTVTGVSNPAGGPPQNFQFLFGVASLLGPSAISFPPDPIKDFSIAFTIDAGGIPVAFTAEVDVTSSSGGGPAPGTAVAFNPQPEPPALGLGDFETYGLDFAVTSLSDVTLTLRILDAVGNQLDLTPIPEPATFALFGFGLAGLGFARHRERVRCQGRGRISKRTR
jgi:hypothetical protein